MTRVIKTNGLLILTLSIDLAGQTHTNATGNVANTLAPDILVDSRVDDDLLSVHGLLGELADHIHGTRSLSLESTTPSLKTIQSKSYAINKQRIPSITTYTLWQAL